MATLTLHNGDCLEVMKEIADKSVDLIICDLPYGCLSSGKPLPEDSHKKYGNSPNKSYSGCAWDVKIDLTKFWEQVKRIRRNDNTPTLHFATTKFGYELIKSNEAEFRYDLIWDKGRGVSFLQVNKMPMRSHEMIYVFSKSGAYYNRVDISGNFKAFKSFEREYQFDKNRHGGNNRIHKAEGNDGTKRCALSIINVANSAKKGNHPTEKPSDLYKWLIERYCPAEGTVLDPTAGSCNSVFQAFAMGRSGIGIEKDAIFYKKAEERLNALP